MSHSKDELANILSNIDFGSSVAENDPLLESARVDTSAFNDLLADKVDLIPGTKGSGKSALYRIFVDFLPNYLLEQRKIVIAHGVQHRGDQIFQAYSDTFDKMDESSFVDFWCIYLMSLANEQFIKNSKYSEYLKACSDGVESFRKAYTAARIPEFQKPKSLSDTLGWILEVIRSWSPTFKYRPPGNSGVFEMNLFGEKSCSTMAKEDSEAISSPLPQYVHHIKNCLESILRKIDFSLWLMIDRLDEIFLRRSQTETLALRGLLRTLRIFESKEIRVKVFLRDDMLEQVVSSGKGFTALTHITSRQADTLRWLEDQILTMIVKRIYANESIKNYLKIDEERIEASASYQRELFYQVFPSTVDRGSNTLRWIYNHTADGLGVVTPRDVIELLTRAKQRQTDEFMKDLSGQTDYIIGPAAIKYGLKELSNKKKTTYLDAEFPHLKDYINKFVGKKTEYSEKAIMALFGNEWQEIIENLVSVGVIRKEIRRGGEIFYKIPFVYREGLKLTQGRFN